MTEKRKQMLRKIMPYIRNVPFQLFEPEVLDEFNNLKEEIKEVPQPQIEEHNVMIFFFDDEDIETNFRCKCGANVFTRYDDGSYKCNGCNRRYIVEDDTDE
jgi:hypothetical protein